MNKYLVGMILALTFATAQATPSYRWIGCVTIYHLTDGRHVVQDDINDGWYWLRNDDGTIYHGIVSPTVGPDNWVAGTAPTNADLDNSEHTMAMNLRVQGD